MASKKRGLSLEEKRSRLLDIFYQKKDFFLLKELEKIAPKEKGKLKINPLQLSQIDNDDQHLGIVSQSVKDVLQSLVDDDLVDTEKIGTSVYFWSFPSKQTAKRKRKLVETEAKLEDSAKKLKVVQDKIKEAKKGREETKEREEALKKLIDMKARKEELEKEIQKYKDCAPEILKKLQDEIKMAKDGANRWTDNIFALHSWISKKFPSISIADLNKQFQIPEDLDYVA